MADDDPDRALANLRKRRGVIRGSITRLGNKLRDLEATPDEPDVADRAKQLLSKLESLDKDFKSIHFDVIDLIDVKDLAALEKEQDTLDRHDDEITSTTLRLQPLVAKLSVPASGSGSAKALSRKLSRLERSIKATEAALADIKDDHDDVDLLELYRDQLADSKRELASIDEQFGALGVPDSDDQVTLHGMLEKLHFECSHRTRRLLSCHSSRSSTPSTAGGKGVRLPKLDVPTFDGDVLHWLEFWEQFAVSVHGRTNLCDAEKLVYLQQAIKGGAAKGAIEGLSHSGDHYQEAVDCLKSRYNRPRLIHRAHVRKLVDAPSLKDGSGRELRRLHDTLQQHLRALKSMGCEPDSFFITSMVELKLDQDTMFEWQKNSQDKIEEVPHFQDMLDFLNLRAQASETSLSSMKKPAKSEPPNMRKVVTTGKTVPANFTASSEPRNKCCVVCTTEDHPLYMCPKFKLLPHEDKFSILKTNNLCVNCLGNGHFVRQCKSSRCKKCQRPHHTLLHMESRSGTDSTSTAAQPPAQSQVVSNAAVKLQCSSLLMTCQVLVIAVEGSSVAVRALLDNASSASFISERLVQSLHLPRAHQRIHVSGIAGSSPSSPTKSIASFHISSAHGEKYKLDLNAIVVPKVTCDLPVYPVPFDLSWTHIADVPLADPAFGQPGRIDLLLGVDVFTGILLSGRRTGPPGSPVALETTFGWVISGSTDTGSSGDQVNMHVTALHSSTTCDDILRKFWEIEHSPTNEFPLSLEERIVVRHFEANHRRTKEGRFEVPLPRKPNAKPIGESRSQALRRFLSLERSLTHKNRFQEVNAVIQEYFDLGHAEAVPCEDLEKEPSQVFYLPMHVVYKSSSTTTKVRAVFDASAKSSSGVSLNDTLIVGPTIHPPLVDVLLRFRMHAVALTADVSKMYRAVDLVKSDRDFHRFVWRSSPCDTIRDYRMTRATFGVSASCFAANMAVKQNAVDFAHTHPLAADVVEKAFYVDDCLTGADDVDSAVTLFGQLHDLFSRGGFVLRKWNSNEPSVLQAIPSELRESQEVHPISDANSYTKTLGLEWNTGTDSFRVTISNLLPLETLTKRTLISDVAKVFDVLGWFAPAIICMKILLQRIWELSVGWDDPVPQEIQDSWAQWRSELPALATKPVPRCYRPKGVKICSVQLHGFSDASEDAYAGVVYLRMVDSAGGVHTALVIAKTKVSPIKRQSIPRLELCGAQVLSKLLQHTKEVLQVPLSDTFAWTDSTIVLGWLSGNPRRFKTFVGNRVSLIIDHIPADRWSHVPGPENPADCASRGILPLELLKHKLWWNGPPWLFLSPSHWPNKPNTSIEHLPEEERELCLATIVQPERPAVSFDRFSTFVRLQRVTAWVLRFVKNCRLSKDGSNSSVAASGNPCLTVVELAAAKNYLVRFSQGSTFSVEIASLKAKHHLPPGSCLISLRPFVDFDGILRVGGRERNAKLSYSRMHPIILHGKDPLTRLLIHSEHLRLLHAGPTLVSSSLCRAYHITGLRKITRSITRKCVTCRYRTTRPQPQMLGQLPLERVTPGSVFEKVGVDYAGPLQVKYGMVRKPAVVKAYVCVFVSLAVKAVHLEAVSALTSEAFIATLRRFVARRGCPSLIWSDNGTNFVGANRELREFHEFLADQVTKQNARLSSAPHTISNGDLFPSTLHILVDFGKRR